MKRYRLIKEYPGSPELGVIVMNGIIGVYKGNPHLSFDGSRRLRNIELPEKYPEFWEEIIEKDYEIITFGFEGGVDRTLDEYGKYSLVTGGVRDSKDGNRLIDLIATTGYYIKSVRRLSDGATFTIGDMCNPVATGYKYNKKPIAKIWFTDSGRLRISSENYTLPIDGIEHSKMLLFTTGDGVDIYENDSFYMTVVPFNDKNKINICKQIATKYYKNYRFRESELIFSTKEAAEEYIILNKPCLSILDIAPIIGRANEATHIDLKKLTKDLMEKVKTYM